VIVAHN
jgi:hypothetical protein